MSYTTEITDWKTAGAEANCKNIIWFVAKEDGKVLARAGLRQKGPNVKEGEIHFYRIVVDPEHRGKGLWSLLIDARLEYARQQNAHTVFCECEDHRFPITEIMVKKGFVEVSKKGKLTLVKMDLNKSSDSTTA